MVVVKSKKILVLIIIALIVILFANIMIIKSKKFSKIEKENEDYIRYSYYELKVKDNLSEEEIDEVLRISRDYFENKGYKVYFTNAEFEYQNAKRKVEINEYMIAFKE